MRQRKRRISQIKLIRLTMTIGMAYIFLVLLSEHQLLTEIKRTHPEVVYIVQTGTEVAA